MDQWVNIRNTNKVSPKLTLQWFDTRRNDRHTSQWRHNEGDGLSNHQPHCCLLNRLFRRRSKKTSKLRVTGLCAGKSPVTDKFPAQRASNAENVSIWWRHHENFTQSSCYSKWVIEAFWNLMSRNGIAPKWRFGTKALKGHCEKIWNLLSHPDDLRVTRMTLG